MIQPVVAVPFVNVPAVSVEPAVMPTAVQFVPDGTGIEPPDETRCFNAATNPVPNESPDVASPMP